MAINLVAHSNKHGHVHKDTTATKRLANAHNWAVYETAHTYRPIYPLDETINGIPTEQRAIVLFNPVNYTTTPNGQIVTGLISEGSRYMRNLEIQIDVYTTGSPQATERLKDTCIYVCKLMQPYSLSAIGGASRYQVLDMEQNIPLPVYINTRTTSTLGITPRADFTKHKKFVIKIPDVQFFGPFDKLVAFFSFSYYGPYQNLNLQIDQFTRFEFISLNDKRVFNWPLGPQQLMRPIDGLPDAPNEATRMNEMVPQPSKDDKMYVQQINHGNDQNGFNSEYEAMTHVGGFNQNLESTMQEEDAEQQKRIDQATQAFNWDGIV